jgi:hypothetical protein
MLGWSPCPDVPGASEEADAESTRMPQKQVDYEGCQNPTSKKSKPGESSIEEFVPPKWQDFRWKRPVIFLTRTKFRFPLYY